MAKRYVVGAQSFLLLFVFAFSSGASAGIFGRFCRKPSPEAPILASQLKLPVVSHKIAADSTEPRGNLRAEFVELPADENAAVRQILKMFVFSTAPLMKQDKRSEKIDHLTLGVPLRNGYILELTYKAHEGGNTVTDANGEEVVLGYRGLYFDNKAELVAPNFIRSKNIRLDIIRRDGLVDVQKKLVEPVLADIPDLRNFNFDVQIPNEISGKTLTLIEQIASKLQFYPRKADLLPYLVNEDPKSFEALLSRLRQEEYKSQAADYSFKGVFKLIAKVWQKPVIWIGAGLSALTIHTVAPEFTYDTYKQVTSVFTFTEDRVIISSLQGLSTNESIPKLVRDDLGKTIEYARQAARAGQLDDYLRDFPTNHLSSEKAPMDKKVYVWFETRLADDKKPIEIMYVMRAGRVGDTISMAMAVDPKLIPNLYSYVKSKNTYVKLGGE